MKKKLLALLLGGCMVFGMLSGCGSGGQEAPAEETTTETSAETEKPADTPSEEAKDSDEPAEITMFVSSPEYADAINALIEAYKEVKPNVTINYETTQNDYPTLLKAKLNSGDCPDIFSSTSGKEIAVYEDYSANLTDQPLSDAMSAAVRDVMMLNDEVHGLSIKGNFFGIVYNKDIFAEVGITEFPQTVAELKEAAELIAAAGYTPFTTGFAEWWVFKHVFQSFLNEAQPDDVEALVKDFAAGNAKMKDYPEIYDGFFDFIDLAVKYGDAKPLETDLSGELAAFASGKTAMICGQGAWVEADILKINPDIKIGFDGYPVNEDVAACKVVAGSDQAIRIYKDSEVLDEVLEFCNWWYTSDYGKSWFVDVAGVIPPIDDAVAPDFEIIKQGNAHVESEGAGTLSIVYSTDSFHQAFGEIMQSYIAGTLDKDGACQAIEAKWVELEGAE